MNYKKLINQNFYNRIEPFVKEYGEQYKVLMENEFVKNLEAILPKSKEDFLKQFSDFINYQYEEIAKEGIVKTNHSLYLYNKKNQHKKLDQYAMMMVRIKAKKAIDDMIEKRTGKRP